MAKKAKKRTPKEVNIEPLPPLNARFREQIALLSDNSVSKMATILGTTQQRLNRIFLIDERTNKYPVIPTDIILRFLDTFKQVDARLFLLGTTEEATNEPIDAKISYNELKEALEQCQMRYAKLMMRLERKEEELDKFRGEI